MPLSLNGLLSEVNDLLSALDYASNSTFYKFTYLQPKVDREGTKVFPMVRTNQSDGIQISPQDIKSMIFYHRLIEQTDEPIPTQGKGNDTVSYTTYTFRLVGIGHRRKLSALTDEDNTDIAQVVRLLLNGKMLSDSSKVWPISTNTDKISIFNEEWEGYDFDKLSLELTAFSIDYNIRQRIVCTPGYVPPTAITSFTYSNNGQTVESGGFQAMIASVLPSNGTYSFAIDANDTLPTGLSLNATTGAITRTSMIPNGSYSFDVIVTGSGRAFGVASVRVTLTVASIVPTLTNATDTATGSDTGSGTVDTDEGTGTLYWVVTQSATTPSAAQIIAGQDHTGSAADDSGNQVVSATGTQNVSFTGLTASTTYYAHFVQRDSDINNSNTISADGFTTTSGYTYLLDTYGSATYAFAVTKLRSAYSGSCIRVRRSGDDAEQDIGFSGNDLDETAITTFCGLADGFIVTWYDQSGNGNDISISVPTQQPEIFRSGAVVKTNLIPSPDFAGSDFLQDTGVSMTSPYSFFMIKKIDTTGNQAYMDGNDGALNVIIGVNSSKYRIFAGSNVFSATNEPITQELLSAVFNSPNSTLHANGVSVISSGSTGTNTLTGLTLGAAYNGLSRMDGKIQLFVAYNSDQSANRAAIETIINDIYSIY